MDIHNRNTKNTFRNSKQCKAQLESWYSSNLASYASKIADGKYCNDRTVGSGTWSATGSQFYYGGYTRLYTNKAPSLSCDAGDVYTLKAGLITADEVAYAGGVYGTSDSKYYLYNGQSYWTMSPIHWKGSSAESYAQVFRIDSKGYLANTGVVNFNIGLRPVINLKSDTTFSGGKGTQSNPYVVQ